MANPGPSTKEQELLEQVLSFKYDPEGFCLFAFPWKEPRTPLANYSGPRKWQREEFEKIRQHMLSNKLRVEIGLSPETYYLSISSGRGPGKSAFLAMLNYWMASCWWGGTGIVTANTETQLRTRTMAEIGKWHTMSINRHWFEKSAMNLTPSRWFTELLQNQLRISTEHYYVQGQTWSEDNPDAFAGAHSPIAMMLTMDESSGIPDAIWNVAEGFFTDLAELRIWATISNPRRNSGKFYDCFYGDNAFWNTRYIDSRTVEGLDPAVYQRIADKYGEDSDVTRVEVRGMFPLQGTTQLISPELVKAAQQRELTDPLDNWEPLIMGVDVARYGNNKSVVRFRRGRDARSIPPVDFQGISTMELAQHVGNLINKYKPDAIMVDGGGVGGGVVDRLKQMKYRVIEVQGGERPMQPDRYINKRTETWDLMKEWLETACLDDSMELYSDLITPEYKKHDVNHKLILESKDHMATRGKPSPDHADALALTFARPVARINSIHGMTSGQSMARDIDYDIFGT